MVEQYEYSLALGDQLSRLRTTYESQAEICKLSDDEWLQYSSTIDNTKLIEMLITKLSKFD